MSKYLIGEEPPLITKQNIRQGSPSQAQRILNFQSLWHIGAPEHTVQHFGETFKMSCRNTIQRSNETWSRRGAVEAGDRGAHIFCQLFYDDAH